MPTLQNTQSEMIEDYLASCFKNNQESDQNETTLSGDSLGHYAVAV